MTYTNQEKAVIVAQYQQGTSVQELSEKYGVCERTIYRWAKKHNDIVSEEKRTLTAKEYDMLLHRVEKLENIVAILRSPSHTAAESQSDKSDCPVGNRDKLRGNRRQFSCPSAD